ncbi:hypothetical protein [Halogranum rubrum]|uniref:hypothetical protein n=1 Tax=Halogranum rubrum TaxID=553466 RepID=UPI0011604D46|nr:MULTISPECIES: hypothetical protein [Halogranum]
MSPPLSRRRFLTLSVIAGASAIFALSSHAEVTLFGSNRVRCRGDPVSIEKTVLDKPGYDDGFEYISSKKIVRTVTLANSEGPVEFTEQRFKRWATIQCRKIGSQHVEAVTAERLGTDKIDSAIGTHAEKSVIVLEPLTNLTSDSNPAVSVSQLADVAPKSVTVTVTLEDSTLTQSVAVFADYVARRPG